MLLLLVANASASSSLLICNYGDLLSNIVGIARRETGPDVTIQIADDCTNDLAEILLSPSSYGATNYAFIPEASSGHVVLPPIAVTGGASLHLERITIESSSANLGIPDFGAEYVDLAVGAAIYANGATVTLTDVALVGSTGAGLVAVDSTVSGTSLEASDFALLRPLYVIADAARTSITLSEANFRQNAAGAVLLWGSGDDVEATFDRATFASNGPASGADIASVNVASLSLNDATFYASVGDGTFTSSAAAPVYVDGGSLYCERCDFTDTSGTLASTYAAYLENGDTLEIVEGVLAPASTDDAVMHIDTGGYFSMTTAQLVGAGELRRYGGTTAITSTRFDGAGLVLDWSALKLSATRAVLQGVTLCDYRGASFGLITADGSELVLWESVFHGLALDGAAVVRAATSRGAPSIYLRDNTFAGSTAALVSGEPAELDMVNNLLSEVSAGVAVDTLPAGADVTYNLWHEVAEPLKGGDPDATNVVGSDPRFITSFTAGDCETSPFLQAGSPANAAGDPGESDFYGNPRSDIGALDYDEGDDPVDTDDPGDSGETGLPDTGTPDTGGPGTDTAQDLGLVGGALPPCGCGDGGAAAALLALAPLLARRRRA